MPGPSQASIFSGGVRSRPIQDSITPLARPRQPAEGAISVPSAAHSKTGRQSAVRIASTTPGYVVNAASASGSSPMISAVRRRLRLPCTCRSQRGVDGRAPLRPSKARLASTMPFVLAVAQAEVERVVRRQRIPGQQPCGRQCVNRWGWWTCWQHPCCVGGAWPQRLLRRASACACSVASARSATTSASMSAGRSEVTLMILASAGCANSSFSACG